MKNKKGRHHAFFITVEGIEGVGKSTAIRFLENYFLDHHQDFIVTREPGGTQIAESIRKVVLGQFEEIMSPDTELLLMFAGRAQHIYQVIKPALDAGKTVLCDRFTDATYAYQGGGREIATEKIALLEKLVQNDLQPHLTLLLDAPSEVGLHRILTRGSKDRIEEEQIDFFERVRRAYLQRAHAYPERFKIINANQSLEEVQHQLKIALQEFFQNGRENPLPQAEEG